jgi:hypothetical protein
VNRYWSDPEYRTQKKQYDKDRLRAQPRELIRIKMRLWKYGLSAEIFDALWKKQKGLCAICHEPMSIEGRGSRSVVVDHAHICCPGVKSCGACIRDLLHNSCNQVIGRAQESKTVLLGAIEYLIRWEQKDGNPTSHSI